MRNQIEAAVQPADVCFVALKGHCDSSTVNHGSKINGWSQDRSGRFGEV